ncbi:unnamed protein product [Linum tenue]|uniref:SPARK domain-containing protein n=1 Tax=Linum tenue TaxID=586396 RepID=A0AAV0ISW4_9ROSI|nr:unnamed protein product [Linum tenue]
MSSLPHPPLIPSLFLLLLTFFPILLSGLPLPDPEPIQPFHPTQSPPSTIPAFPEQSTYQACPLDLPAPLFHGVKSACSTSQISSVSQQQLHKARCCPVLAAWLYSAYSATALGHPAAANRTSGRQYDMPLLPDDSETCVDALEKGLREKGIQLPRVNESCDAVYCYCGIRLHPLSCPEAFSLDAGGKLVGDRRVRRLERDCLSSSSRNVNGGLHGLSGCSKCLTTLNSLNSNKNKEAWNASNKTEERSTKMRNKDCQLMGLTWLLAKNRTAYIQTVSAVLRAIMTNNYDSGNGMDSQPHSCALNRDGMPLAVDSSEIENSSWSITRERWSIYGIISVVALISLLNLVLLLP